REVCCGCATRALPQRTRRRGGRWWLRHKRFTAEGAETRREVVATPRFSPQRAQRRGGVGWLRYKRFTAEGAETRRDVVATPRYSPRRAQRRGGGGGYATKDLPGARRRRER